MSGLSLVSITTARVVSVCGMRCEDMPTGPPACCGGAISKLGYWPLDSLLGGPELRDGLAIRQQGLVSALSPARSFASISSLVEYMSAVGSSDCQYNRLHDSTRSAHQRRRPDKSAGKWPLSAAHQLFRATPSSQPRAAIQLSSSGCRVGWCRIHIGKWSNDRWSGTTFEHLNDSGPVELVG